MARSGLIIVGAGEAGTRAALALREIGYEGPLTLIGEEAHPPYERPPLSKAVLAGKAEPGVPKIAAADRCEALGIERLIGRHVTAVDPAGHRLTTKSGDTLQYDRLCLATGAKPRELDLPGGDLCHYLRTYDDALRLRPYLEPGRRIVLIGGGVIGLEIAAAARARGCAVTVIEAAPRLLNRAVPAVLAERIECRHRAAGVSFHFSAKVSVISRTTAGHLTVGVGSQDLAADCVVVGIGVLPDTALAAKAGLALDNGIELDHQLCTSDPDIFAAGDCASFPHPLYDGRRIRLETWRNAQDQGNFVAHSLLGRAGIYQAVPWFWSDQYELHMQIAGLVDEAEQTITRKLDQASLWFHLGADGRLVAASGLGALGQIGKEIRLAELLIGQRAHPDPDALASPQVKLKGLLAARDEPGQEGPGFR